MRLNKFISLTLLFLMCFSSYTLAITASDPDTLIYYSYSDASLSGSNPLDLTPHSNDGTSTSMTTGQSGIIDESFGYNAATDKVVANSTVVGTGDKTVVVWVKFTGSNGVNWDWIMGNTEGISSNQDGFELLKTDSTNEISVNIGNGATSGEYLECDSTGTITDSNWHSVAFIQNSTGVYLYLDNNLANGCSDTSTSGSETAGDQNLQTGARQAGGFGLIGNIDELVIFDRALDESELDYLYNSGSPGSSQQYPFGVSNTDPSVSLIFPTNADHLNDDPVLVSFNVTDSDDDLCNCTIRINSTLKTTLTNINTTSDPLQYYNLTTSEGNQTLNISCTDGIATAESVSNFVIDRVSPDWLINTMNTDNTTIIDRSTQTWMLFNDSLDDNYLFAYNVTTYYPNGTVWFTNQTTDLNVTDFNYVWNKSIDVSQPNGTYKTTYYAEDDHTAKEIAPIAHTITNQNIRYHTAEGDIIIENVRGNLRSVNTVKSIDRYSFEFEPNNNRRVWDFVLTCPSTLYYRGGLYEYPTFVCGKNWVDFVPDSSVVSEISSVSASLINDNQYRITIEKTNSRTPLRFNSLGGLNIVNESYTFQIKENQAPTITNTTPNQNISVNDGINQTFYTNATDIDGDSISYEYFWNGASIGSTQNFTYLMPYNSHGINNMTVVASDGGKSDSYTWNVNITHVAVTPIVTSIVRTPLTTWYENVEDTAFVCSGYDLDNETAYENLTAEIDYRSGVIWSSLTVENNNDGTFNANVSLTGLAGETLDVRCRITDNDFGFTSYFTESSIVTVEEAYTAPGNITNIAPNGGQRDYMTSVTCSIDDYGTIPSYLLLYDIDAYYEGSWHNLSNNFFNKAVFDMALINYSDTVKFRCAADDGFNKTAFVEGDTVTRTHINNLFMFGRGNDEVINAYKPYYKGLLVDFYNEANISIVGSYVDCNGDNYWDYYWDYTDGRNSTKEHFSCINSPGIIQHTVGLFINKTGTNDLFCGDSDTGICKIERTYGVLVK